MTIMYLTIKVFRHEISHVVVAGDFHKLEVARPELILDPQVRHRKVAYPAQSATAADANCRRCVAVHQNFDIKSEVMKDSLESASFTGTLANSCELRLAELRATVL